MVKTTQTDSHTSHNYIELYLFYNIQQIGLLENYNFYFSSRTFKLAAHTHTHTLRKNDYLFRN